MAMPSNQWVYLRGGKKGQLNSHQGIYVHEVGRAIGLKMFMGEKKITLLWLSM